MPRPAARLAVGLLAAALAAPSVARAQDAVPIGEVTKHTFAASKIFPGTTRTFWVYVPKQYDGTTPACVYVNQDGPQFGAVVLDKDRTKAVAPGVFDKLIAEKAMPVTVGVFVTPGVVPTVGDALPRFNRSYEYDGLGDAYARFVLDELLPTVEKLKTADGREIRLSKNGNDRAIGGSSSGAICAFTAAWERPDAFSRVFSSIGTYVGLRGGNAYPTLVRKVEPKPIRVFLEDGENDLNIYGGDWWMANQEMERALTFAGYEVEHRWGKGGHNGQHATELFPDAMRWLWKGWPEPVKAGRGSPQMREILADGQGWQLVGGGYKFTEGPATNAKGEVFFNDVGAKKTYKVGSDGKPAVFLDDSKGGDGQRFGPDGRLYANAAAEKKLLAWDADGKAAVVADGFKGNDLVVNHAGGIYVTDPFETANNSKVYYVSPKGEKKVVDTGLRFANGITLSPDQSLLYVADSRSHWVYSYQVRPDGSLAHKQKFYHLHVRDTEDESGADGLRADRDGRLWVATRYGLQVCDQAGRVLAILPTPNRTVSNLTFSGPNFDVLYATCGDKVYRRPVKVKGANAFDAPFKPKPPQL